MAKITDYKPLSKNPNKGTQKGVGVLDKSVRELGAGRSLLVDKDGIIIAGNHAQEAFVNAGIENVIEVETDGTQIVVVKRTDMSADSIQGKKMAIMDNRASELGLDWDAVVLEEMMEDIKAQEGELDGWLENLAEEEKIQLKEPSDAEPQINRAEELNKKWQVQTGDLWRIGEHRLLCGDGTKREDVERVMGGDKANMVFTDPPYGVSYVGSNNPTAKTWEPLENDNCDKPGLMEFLKKAFSNIYIYTNSDVALYCWHASRTQIQFEQALNESGFEVKQQLIWNKGMVLGRSDYHWAHEPCFYCKKTGESTNWYGDRTAKTILGLNRTQIQNFTKEMLIKIVTNMIDNSTTWEVSKDSVLTYMHSTQKPTRLATNALINSSIEEQIVIDFFLGSGTTMVACENLNRKCRGIEISPNYCAVILERMSTAFPDLVIEKINA